MNTKMSKNTVAEIKDYLNSNMAEVTKRAKKKDKLALTIYKTLVDLSKRVKDGEKVLKAEFVAVAEQVQQMLTTPVAADEKPKAQPKAKAKAEPKKESSLKAKAGKAKKAEAEPKAEPKQTKKAVKKEEPEKSDAQKFKELVETTFPEQFEDEDYKYSLADDLADMDSLRKAIEDGEDIFVARYTPASQLDEYCKSQDGTKQVDIPKQFPGDRDMLCVVYVGDVQKVFYAVSVYTEGCQCYLGSKMKPMKKLHGCRKGTSLYKLYRAEEKA